MQLFLGQANVKLLPLLQRHVGRNRGHQGMRAALEGDEPRFAMKLVAFDESGQASLCRIGQHLHTAGADTERDLALRARRGGQMDQTVAQRLPFDLDPRYCACGIS